MTDDEALDRIRLARTEGVLLLLPSLPKLEHRRHASRKTPARLKLPHLQLWLLSLLLLHPLPLHKPAMRLMTSTRRRHHPLTTTTRVALPRPGKCWCGSSGDWWPPTK